MTVEERFDVTFPFFDTLRLGLSQGPPPGWSGKIKAARSTCAPASYCQEAEANEAE